MIKFEHYHHIHDLFVHCAKQENRPDILDLLINGLASLQDAKNLCRFTWKIAELVNTNEEYNNLVLGSTDNTDMLADLSYEISKLMCSIGYEAIWQRTTTWTPTLNFEKNKEQIQSHPPYQASKIKA